MDHRNKLSISFLVTPCFPHFGQLPLSQSNPCIRICQYKYLAARYRLQCKKPEQAPTKRASATSEDLRLA
jgi:hypothetical protein